MNAADRLLTSGNLPVTLSTQIAGEDLTNNVLKVEERFNYSFNSLPSLSIVKSGSGFLHAVNIGMVSSPTITIYDNTTNSGQIIQNFNAGYPQGSYVLDVSFTTGLSIQVATGLNAQLMLSYR